MLILGVFSALAVLTVHTGVGLFMGVVFEKKMTVFTVLVVGVCFGLYANLCIFDSFEGYGFVLGRVLQFWVVWF